MGKGYGPQISEWGDPCSAHGQLLRSSVAPPPDCRPAPADSTPGQISKRPRQMALRREPNEPA
eukprot:2548636-Alexandrium_andersonii.AAC.1